VKISDSEFRNPCLREVASAKAGEIRNGSFTLFLAIESAYSPEL
jgi:hypothetical protein